MLDVYISDKKYIECCSQMLFITTWGKAKITNRQYQMITNNIILREGGIH